MDTHSASNVLYILSSRCQYLNPALKRIADYVLSNLEKCKTITIKDLALACDVAESTITRFVKEMGYSSFQDFKIAIAESLMHQDSSNEYTEESIYEDISKEDNIDNIIQKVFQLNMQKMYEAKKLINITQLEMAVAAIKAAETLIFVSTGSSTVAATEAIMRFTRAGKRCIFWSDSSMQRMVSATTTGKDLIIGISDSGKTTQVVNAIKQAAANGSKSIGITSDSKSPLAGCCDIVLYTPQNMASGRIKNHWESMTSKNAQLLMTDILYVSFAIEQYDQTVENLNRTSFSLKTTRD